MSEDIYKKRLEEQIEENNKLQKENKEMLDMLDFMSDEVNVTRNENEILMNQLNFVKVLLYEKIGPKKKDEIEKILNEKKNTIQTSKKNTKIQFSEKENKKKKDLSKEDEKKKKELEQKLTKLTEEKEVLEINFISIKDKNDFVLEKINSQKNKQNVLNDLKMNINDTVNILNEQKQVEPEFFIKEMEFDIVNIQILSLNDAIISIRDKLNYANNNLKNKIENLQGETQNQLNTINDYLKTKDEKYINECKKIIEILKTNISECDKLSKNFLSTQEEINKIQTDLETTLLEIKVILETFLEKITKKIEEKNKNQNSQLTNSLLSKTRYKDNRNFGNNFENKNIDLRESIFIDEIIDPKQFFEPQLLKTNWQEFAQIASDGTQTIEVKFTLKAVACQGLYYTSYTHIFDLDSNIIMISAEVNGREIKPNFAFHRLNFNFSLHNNQSLPIRFVYIKEPLEKKKFYNQIHVGLSSALYGRKAHYTLNISKDLVICRIDDNFFKDKGNGTYSWQGIVPYGGKNTLIALTPIKSKWKIYKKDCFFSNGGNIHYTTLKIPKYFESANNKILSYNVKNNSSDYLDGFHIIQIRDKIESIYENLNTPNGFIIFDVTLENTSNQPFECLKEVNIPQDEEINKIKFKTLANKIIEDDKSNIPNYVKIGKWIKKNLTYKLSFAGRRLTAIEILECKQGVCEHFTILYNALLNSINIPAIYAYGHTVEGSANNEINPNLGHCWTVAKINNKWIGLDVTWGILTGNLPTSHIFFGYGNDGISYQFRYPDLIVFDKRKNELKIDNIG